MTDSIETAFVTQFQTNVAMLLQQSDSRLRGAVTPFALHGEAAEVLEQFGETTAVTGLARHSDTPLMDVPQDRRWCYPTDAEWAILEDNQDKLRLLIDPQGPYAKAGTAALNRKIDDVIVSAFFGSAHTGKTGATLVAFPSANEIAADVGSGSDTGMNVAKLREARRLLRKAEIDFEAEKVYAALCADKESDLLSEATVVSTDFNTKPVLADGRLMQFLGFDFVHTERFAGGAKNGDGADGYDVPVWVKSGIGLGVWNDVNASVAPRVDKRNAMQVYLKMTIGATRLEEARVLKILNAAKA